MGISQTRTSKRTVLQSVSVEWKQRKRNVEWRLMICLKMDRMDQPRFIWTNQEGWCENWLLIMHYFLFWLCQKPPLPHSPWPCWHWDYTRMFFCKLQLDLVVNKREGLTQSTLDRDWPYLDAVIKMTMRLNLSLVPPLDFHMMHLLLMGSRFQRVIEWC